MDGGRLNQRNPGHYEAAQVARVPVKLSEDDEKFVFDIQPDRVDTVKFVAAQRKLVDHISIRYPDVGKIFSHGYNIKHTYPEKPEPLGDMTTRVVISKENGDTSRGGVSLQQEAIIWRPMEALVPGAAELCPRNNRLHT